MKKTIFMITAAASMMFASCGDKTTKTEGDATATDSTNVEAAATVTEPEAASIVGSWKLTNIELGMEVPKGKEQAMEDMKKKMYAETSFTFNEDGTMTSSSPVVKDASGTYTYEDSKLSITDSKTKKAEVLTVDELTANKLVISSEQNGKKATMTFSK
jgi:hypothetical protein